MTKEDALRKVSALLAIVEDHSNDHECQIALLKAREMMSKYEIQISQVSEFSSKENVQEISTGVDFTARYTMWKLALARMMSKYHRCMILMSGKYRKSTRVISFVGEGADAELLSKIYSKVVQFINAHIWSLHESLSFETARVRYIHGDSYAKGFIDGLEQQYIEQNKRDPGMALMVITPDSVIKHMNKYDAISLESSAPDLLATLEYSQGYQDGYEYTDMERIEEKV